jgi:hypothetical protein
MQSETIYQDDEESHRVHHYLETTAKSRKPLLGVVTELAGHLFHEWSGIHWYFYDSQRLFECQNRASLKGKTDH